MRKIHVEGSAAERALCGNKGTNLIIVPQAELKEMGSDFCKVCKIHIDKKENAVANRSRHNIRQSDLSVHDEMMAEAAEYSGGLHAEAQEVIHESNMQDEADAQKEEKDMVATAKKEIKETLKPMIVLKIARMTPEGPVVMKEYSTPSIKVARGFTKNPNNISLGNILVKEQAGSKNFYQRKENKWVEFTPENPDAI